MKDPATGLRRMIAMAAASGDPDQLRAADGLALWLGSDAATLEVALGLPSTWRSADRRRRRDEIYAEIARTFFPNLTGLPLARETVTAIDRYESSGWRRDRDNGRRPDGINGLIFDLLALRVRLLDVEALRKLPGIFHTCEYQAHDLRSGEQEENHLEYDDQVFEGNESG